MEKQTQSIAPAIDQVVGVSPDIMNAVSISIGMILFLTMVVTVFVGVVVGFQKVFIARKNRKALKMIKDGWKVETFNKNGTPTLFSKIKDDENTEYRFV